MTEEGQPDGEGVLGLVLEVDAGRGSRSRRGAGEVLITPMAGQGLRGMMI